MMAKIEEFRDSADYFPRYQTTISASPAACGDHRLHVLGLFEVVGGDSRLSPRVAATREIFASAPLRGLAGREIHPGGRTSIPRGPRQDHPARGRAHLPPGLHRPDRHRVHRSGRSEDLAGLYGRRHGYPATSAELT